VNDNTIIGAGGEYSDFQYILRLLDQLTTEDFAVDDGAKFEPKELHSYLGRVMYNRRSKINPLWNSVIVAGWTPGEAAASTAAIPTGTLSGPSPATTTTTTTTTAAPGGPTESKGEEKKEEKKTEKKEEKTGKCFLGLVDLYGSNYTGDFLATGYGMHMGLPLLRKHWRPDMSYEEARKLLEECMTVLIYRDCYSLNKFTVGTVTATGATVSEPFKLKTYWEHSRFINPQM